MIISIIQIGYQREMRFLKALLDDFLFNDKTNKELSMKYWLIKKIKSNTRFNLTLRISRKCRLSECYAHTPMAW